MAYNLNLLGAAITLLLGLWSIWRPEPTAKAIGFSLHGRRGRAEFRIGFGGFFLGLAGYALYLRNDSVFMAMGAMWLGAAVIRVLALLIDRPPFNVSYLGVLLFESAMGAMLIY
jgi:hypothetical protein